MVSSLKCCNMSWRTTTKEAGYCSPPSSRRRVRAEEEDLLAMAVDLPVVGAVLVYYIVVVCCGVWYGRKIRSGAHPVRRLSAAEDSKHREATQNPFLERLFVADRKLPLAVGICSMTATWVGGGYLSGTAEAVYTRGVLHCHAPISYAISLVLGGSFFAQKIRETNAFTMLDPFQEHYGRWMGLLLCLPAVCGEIFWTAAMLAALVSLRDAGATAAAITEVDPGLFIVLSATAIFFYTALGGFYSVSYTDVFQIGSTAACLWICVPYVSSSPAVGAVGPPHNDWIGTIAVKDVAQLLDAFLMTALGGIPWQAPLRSHGADFTAAGYRGPWMLRERDSYSVLPYAVRYLMPASASVVGMVGITAAVMSSADSSMLSASTMVTRNIYLVLLRPTVSLDSNTFTTVASTRDMNHQFRV
ncbi:hypothetical protein V5799_020527 [Amblyomma americanum]|uniref:Uncharacterized protein n=1 Tax=Amblyomma americanum TaxID=6943 RepID=A0AAQ4ETU9_AMBAM